MLPIFLVIGGMKCGTTSLDHYLKAHPLIAMPRKEIDFFSRKFDLGLDWYLSQLQINHQQRHQILGEVSVSYAKYPYHKGVPKNIYSVFPNVKMIYIVRDPIDRIVSHYMHMVYTDSEERTLEEIFQDKFDNLYLYYSLYYLQLEKFFPYFKQDQFLIVDSIDLRNMETRQDTVKRIFNFIGVQADIDSKRILETKHQSSQKGKKNRFAKLVARLPFYRKLTDMAPDGIRRAYIRLFTQKVDPPDLPDELKAKLMDIIRPDAQKLRRFTGQSFGSWCLQ